MSIITAASKYRKGISIIHKVWLWAPTATPTLRSPALALTLGPTVAAMGPDLYLLGSTVGSIQPWLIDARAAQEEKTFGLWSSTRNRATEVS